MSGAKSQGFRQSMAALHTWVGLLPGWLLFLIFLFGTTAYFQQEISRWMRPEMSASASSRSPSFPALAAADTLLRDRATGAQEWNLSLPARGGQVVRVSWEGGEAAEGKATLDPATGREITVRETQGGNFLYRFHYDLYAMPRIWARSLVSIAALAMLVAILSGVVTHKKIFADFFTLRFWKGQRSWLDSHNVTAVLALPFHLMITYTGLAALLFTIMPWALDAQFPARKAFNAAAYPDAPEFPASGRTGAMLPLPVLAEKAEALWGGGHLGGLSIDHPGDANATASAYALRDRLGRPSPRLILSASDGRLLYRAPTEGGARATQDVMILLHLGTFAETGLRWLYFVSGALGTAMVGTGLVLWTVKRRQRLPDPGRPHFGFRLVERLNIAMMVGSVAGIAAYFLANRLLPLDVALRDEWEIDCLFLVWGCGVAWALARPAARAWIETLAVSAALYALVPLVNSLTTTRGLVPSLIAGDWVFVGFDLMMFVAAGLLAFAAWRLAARKAKVTPRRTRTGTAIMA